MKTTPAASETALCGRRVLELAGEKGVYCGKLLADMGADVIKIERPDGDPARQFPPVAGAGPARGGSLFFLYMNTSKRSVTLDIARPEGRELFLRLARTADAVTETFPPGYLDSLGIGYENLRALNPKLVLTSITDFGQTGPHRNFRSSDLVASALGGALYVTGEESDPPVTLAGAQAYLMASVCAAASTMIALYHSTLTGVGQHVDISVEETVVAVTHICGVGKWLDDGIIPKRGGTGLFASVPSGTYPCRDGLVYLMINRPLHWKALAQWISKVTGNGDVLNPVFEGPSSNRQPYRDLLDMYIADLTSRLTVEEAYHEGQGRHIAFTPVNTAAAVARDVHLASRDYFVDLGNGDSGQHVCPGAPYKLTETPWRISRPAPEIGEHNEEICRAELGLSPAARRAPSSLPARAPAGVENGTSGAAPALAGVRVLEFTAGMAGPWIGRFMAYCGAEAIKVESKDHPDVTRLYVPPRAPERKPDPQGSPWFTDWNAGKHFVGLDLTRPEAVTLVKRLVALCDVVVENYSTGVMEKLGLGYGELRRVKPDLVMLSTSGYGDTGPYRRYVTWGPNIEALSGLSTLSGFPERQCTITQYAYPDALSALHGIFAVMCALDYRLKTGRGQYINLSQLEVTVSAVGHVLMEYLVNGREPQRVGNRSLRAAPHGCYRCRGEDRWCAIAVFTDAEWRRFCAVAAHPEWADDPRFATGAARLEHVEEVDQLVEQWTSTRPAYEIMAQLQQAGIAAGVVQNVEDQFRRDPQLRARGFFEEIEHVTRGKVVAAGIPLGLMGTPGRTGRAGAALGQDNEYVFGELLGLSAAEIGRAIQAGLIQVQSSGADPMDR